MFPPHPHLPLSFKNKNKIKKRKKKIPLMIYSLATKPNPFDSSWPMLTFIDGVDPYIIMHGQTN